MKMRMALIGSVAVALALVVVFSGCGSEDGLAGDFDIAGTYTFQVNGSACKLEFRGDGKYYYTGATSGVNKGGSYSVSGNEVAMSYIITGDITTKETFTATKNSDGNVTLKLKGNSPASSILSSFSLYETEITLTKYTAPVTPPPPPVNIEKEDFIGYYSDGGVIEFKSDGAVEKIGGVTSSSFSGEWDISNGNELTISINEERETFIIKEISGNRIDLELKDRSKPNGLGNKFSGSGFYRIQDDLLNYYFFLGQFTVTTEGVADTDSGRTLEFTGSNDYIFYENGVAIYKNIWGCDSFFDNNDNELRMGYGVYNRLNVKTEKFEFIRNGPDFVLTLMDDEAETSRAFEEFGIDAKTLVLTRRATRLRANN
jgi:uncharacterized lipoprotein YehR (DUF1307 family)